MMKKPTTEEQLRIKEQSDKLKSVLRFLNENTVYSIKHYKMQESLKFVIKEMKDLKLTDRSQWT